MVCPGVGVVRRKMARRDDAIYRRGRVWYFDAVINGTRHVERIGKGISRMVAAEIAGVKRAAILRGEALACCPGSARRRSDARSCGGSSLTSASRPGARQGQTIEHVAHLVHKDLANTLRYARVWGKSGFDGQHVGREHRVEDGDVIEMHS